MVELYCGVTTVYNSKVHPGEGDLVIFDSMALHSASPCRNGVPRYAWFN